MTVTSSVREAFSQRLREALEEAGLAEAQLKDLGRRFHVTGQAVRKWLHAESMPNSVHAAVIAKNLGVRRAWLLDGEPPMRSIRMGVLQNQASYRESAVENGSLEEGLSLSAEEYRLLQSYRRLTPTVRQSLSVLLEQLNSKSATGSSD